MPETLDLRTFCYTGKGRYNLKQPFSRGAFTYATDGHIAVCVPRREDVLEDDLRAPAIERFFKDHTDIQWRQLRKVDFPEQSVTSCRECDGRGTVHDCPDCGCDCDECNGTGKIVADCSICIGTAIFDAKYVRMLAALPWIEVPSEILPDEPMPFRFEGGIGVLTQMRAKHPIHHDVSA